jgi:hypothetical protein
MARRKTTAADIGCLAVVFLLAALAFIGPLALAGWSLFCELRALAYRNIRSVRDVLSADEQAMLERAEQQCDHYEDLIAQTMHQGIALGFARRADGLFDARRMQARDLNTRIEALQNQRDIALSNLGHLQNTLGRKLSGWLNAMSGLTGARAGIIAFLVCFIAVTAFTGGSLAPGDLMFGSPLAEPGSRFGTSLASVGVAAVAMFMAGSISRSALAA